MKPVTLMVDDITLTFVSLADFEFCLDGRTEVPARKADQLLRQPGTRLHDEARSIRRVERRFTDVLAKAIEDPASLSRSMRALDRQLFSQDFRWRAIIGAVNELPEVHHDFRRAALVRYLQYLGSRQAALRHAHGELQRHEEAPGRPMDRDTSLMDMRETAIFDVGEMPQGTSYVTLPRGETVKVRHAGEAMALLLSRHGFELLLGSQPRLRDGAGREQALKPGRNVIGRDLDADVTVDAAYRDVSRRHLMVEIAADWLQLTDLSSHGTQVMLR